MHHLMLNNVQLHALAVKVCAVIRMDKIVNILLTGEQEEIEQSSLWWLKHKDGLVLDFLQTEIW